MKQKRILIAGGGITGLSAAYHLQKSLPAPDAASITVVEKSTRFGGVIQTEYRDGFVIEKGPDSFLARKTIMMELSRELGLLHTLVGTNPNARKNYILHHNRLHPMPSGSVMGIPTSLGPFVTSGLVSPLGKLRAALDLLLPAGNAPKDESVGDFLQRRLGKEVAETIAEPLLSGIYAGDAKKLSLQATFPQFREVLNRHGSLIKGMFLSRRQRREDAANPRASELSESARGSVFLTYKHGLSSLVDRLVDHLSAQGVTLLKGWEITRVQKANAEGNDVYRVRFSDGTEKTFDGVILAVPAFVASEMLADYAWSSLISGIPYISVANIVCAFHKKDFPLPPDASGFVVPKKEGRTITACTWTSVKWPHTAPEDRVLLRCYVGNASNQQIVREDDERLLQRVQHDLREIMGLNAAPIFHRVTRLHRSMPQYGIGHLEKLKQFRTALQKEMPHVLVSGAGFEGVGIPDCVRQGKEAADALLTALFSDHSSEPSTYERS